MAIEELLPSQKAQSHQAAGISRATPRWPRRVIRTAKYLAFGLSQYWLLAVIILLWQYVSSSSSHSLQIMLPAPTAVATAAWHLLANGTLLVDAKASLVRVLTAVGVACVIGIPLGVAMGSMRLFRWSVDPVLEFIRPIPPLAWIPLAILWFGVGNEEMEFIIFLAAFFPVVLNTAAGVAEIDPQIIRAAKSLGASSWTTMWSVYPPLALPSVIVGVRIGMGIGWMALVAGELVAASSGLGFLISYGRMIFRSDYILVGMVTIGIIGFLLDRGIRGLGMVLMPWKR